jgi:hypothetical protein
MLQKTEFTFLLYFFKYSFFLSLQTENKLTCHVKTNCFHFVKIDIAQMKATSAYKRRNSETVATPKKTLFTHSTPDDLPNKLTEHSTRALNHSVQIYDVIRVTYTSKNKTTPSGHIRSHLYKLIVVNKLPETSILYESKFDGVCLCPQRSYLRGRRCSNNVTRLA